ncbi:MAG: type II toxin-antitoxin system HipA family toxin [Nisaea sp.]|nr:type II toxin-antitoxin system HipA family toxin [Nisaea sp.]
MTGAGQLDTAEVWIALGDADHRVGTLYRQRRRGGETVSFRYHEDWLANPQRFVLEPALPLTTSTYHPPQGQQIFGTIGDSAPDTWGRQLMRRRERRQAEREGRTPRTLGELDFLLGVADRSRLGALRFRDVEGDVFLAPDQDSVAPFIALGTLLKSVRRIERNEETDEDLRMMFAPGSSLGGARPKASVIDPEGRMAIAKFPKETDEYSVETWEHITLLLAAEAGISTPKHELHRVDGRPVLLSWRFDRDGETRIPFLSALSMLQLTDGQRASYIEIADELSRLGSRTRADLEELYRRMVFNILISNVDDHLRNHGFLRSGPDGWALSPAYDLNPTPTDLKARVLTTYISLDDGTCSIDLALEVCRDFRLKEERAREIIGEVARAVAGWRAVAARVGEPEVSVQRMESAFEHDDLERALSTG